MNILIGVIIGLVVGGGLGIFITTNILRNKLLAKSQQVLVDAEEKAEVIKKDKILQAKEKYLQLKSEYDKQVQERNSKLTAAENKLKQREQVLAQKVEELQKKNSELKSVSDNLNTQIEVLNKRQAEVEKLYKQSVEKLEHIASMTAEEAKENLVEMIKDEARSEASNYVMDIV
jgi:ribonuclease Y